MMSEGDRELVAALHGCNQRGGRMLTVVDLVEAGSCDVSVAGYLCAVMRGGSSVLVGATPGGGGKTTVMCALLNFLPNETRVVVVEREGVLHELPERPTCVLAHEISSAPYYAYIWGETVRRFFEVGRCGYWVASNLHADTLEETYAQLCGLNGAKAEDVAAVGLKVYLGMGGGRRWITTVYEGGAGCDRLIWRRRDGTYERVGDSRLVSRDQEDRMAAFVRELQGCGVRYLEEIREKLSRHSAVGK